MRSWLWALAITITIGAASVLRVVAVWDRLPSVMATHFSGSGNPDGWTSRGSFFALYGIIFAGTVAVMFGIPLLIRRVPPGAINVPHRDYWLAPERLEQAICKISAWMAWFGAALGMLAALVLELVIHANLTRSPLPPGPMWSLLGGFFVFVGLWLVGLWRSFRIPA